MSIWCSNRTCIIFTITWFIYSYHNCNLRIINWSHTYKSWYIFTISINPINNLLSCTSFTSYVISFHISFCTWTRSYNFFKICSKGSTFFFTCNCSFCRFKSFIYNCCIIFICMSCFLHYMRLNPCTTISYCIKGS